LGRRCHIRFLVSTRARWQKKDTIDPRRTWADAANFTSRAAAFLDNFGNQRNVGAFAYRAFTEPFDGRLVQIAAGRQFTSLLLTTFLNDFNGARPISLSTKSDRQVDIVDEAQFQINLLMSLTEHFVFDDPSLRAQQEGQQLIVRDLFQFFLSAVESNRSTRVPSPFRDLLPWVDQAKTDEHRRARRARLAADIVGRLTEDRAFRLHQRLKGGSPGSVLEPVVV
jgi:dGTPase